MDRRVVAVVGGVAAAIVVAVVAVLLLAPRSPEPVADGGTGTPHPNAERPASAEPTVAPESGSAAPTASPGTYAEYSDDAVAAAEGRILLFFHAAWCPQCRSLEADIDARGVPDGYTILKVDYDARQDLRERYGVTLQTTFVEVDRDGAERAQHVAYDEPRLDAVLSALG